MLNTREWKEFKIYDIFNHSRGKRQVAVSRTKGNIAYYSASELNNGLTDFISNPKFIVNTESIIYTTFGDAYYVNSNFSTSDEITILTNQKLNKYNALFICSCIRQNKSKYSFGRKAFSNKIEKDKILLPVDKNNEPDWQFMENYIIALEKNKRYKYNTYLYNILSSIEYKEIDDLSDVEWKDFYIIEICDIESGHDIYEAEREIGNIPYITSTSSNNGLKYFISNTNYTLESNAISVNRNGSVGYCFYHKYSALYSNDCRKLILKFHRNEYVSLFITNQITKQKDKYNYGYKMGTNRLKKQKIMLPINDKKEPDFKYMEQYIKNLIYKKYNQYLNYNN